MDDKLIQAVQNNSSDELTLDYLTKAEAGKDEPTLVATGKATLEPPEQRINEYKIELVLFDVNKSDIINTDWTYDDETRQATKTQKFKAVRPPAIQRARLIGLLSPILVEMGIVNESGEIYATPTIDLKSLMVWYKFLPDIVNIANLMLGIKEDNDYLQNANPTSLIEFFIDVIINEQQIVEEIARFLVSSKSKQSQ